VRWLLIPVMLALLVAQPDPQAHRVFLPVVIGEGAAPAPPPALRGVLLPHECWDCADIAALNGEWTMDWGMTNPCPASNAEYVQMVWCRPTNLDALTPGGWLITGNEPNNKGQCNKTPREIADWWPQYVAKADELDKRLLTPAVLIAQWAWPGYLNQQWLDEFMALIDPDTVDGIALTYYGCDVPALYAQLDAVWAQYHKPIWLTEFGCAFSADPTVFMSQMLEHIADHHVIAYGAFAPHTCDWPWMPPLLNDDGTLTALGAAYAHFKSEEVVLTDGYLR
jgi:hypothetical protein